MEADVVKLPWGAAKESQRFPEDVRLIMNGKPGEYVMQMLFAEFSGAADRKIDQILQYYVSLTPYRVFYVYFWVPSFARLQFFLQYMNRQSEKTLSKFLQRGEDAQFDQLLASFNDVAEHCLPALLRALFDWYDKQNPTDELGNILHKHTKRIAGQGLTVYKQAWTMNLVLIRLEVSV